MNDIEQRIEQVRNDREHGSRWLVREVIAILHDVAASSASNGSIEHIREVAQRLFTLRPAMSALASAAGRIVHEAKTPADVVKNADDLLDVYEHASGQIASYARPLLQGTLMTHSISGTVLDVMVACRSQIERVIVLEGRPRCEGRDMARSLAQNQIAVTLITDAQADIFLPRCQAVVVGADTIYADGDVLNKAGTALLGWAAQGHGVPVYVLAETLKISAQVWQGNMEQLEEKEAEEILPEPLQGVDVRNFYFDRTPAKLITGIITERGMVGRKEILTCARENTPW